MGGISDEVLHHLFVDKDEWLPHDVQLTALNTIFWVQGFCFCDFDDFS